MTECCNIGKPQACCERPTCEICKILPQDSQALSSSESQPFEAMPMSILQLQQRRSARTMPVSCPVLQVFPRHVGSEDSVFATVLQLLAFETCSKPDLGNPCTCAACLLLCCFLGNLSYPPHATLSVVEANGEDAVL